MSKIDEQADDLFDALDAALDRANWRRRCVTITYKKDDFFLMNTIYDQRGLRTAVEAIADHLASTQYTLPPAEVAAVVDNILDEYTAEIKQCRLPEKHTS